MKLSFLIITAALVCSVFGETPPPSVRNAGREMAKYRWRHHHTPTPRPAATPTATPTATTTPTATFTPTATATFTPTATATATNTPTPSPTATAAALVVPVGVSAMLSKKATTIPSIILSNTHIKYLCIGADWCDVEITEGVRDFSSMDRIVAQVPAQFKIKIGLALSGLRKSQGDSVPDWAADKIPDSELISYIDHNPYHATYNQAVSIAVPWSPTWISMKKSVIAALGAHYAGNPKVQTVEAAVYTGTNNDWSVPSGNIVDGIPPTGSTITSRMRSAGYTHAKMVAAGIEVLSAYIDAFPNQVVIWPTGPVTGGLETDPISVAREVRDAVRSKYGASHLMVANYGISNKMPSVPPPTTGDLQVLYESQPNTGGQDLWNVFGDTSYRMNGGVPSDPVTIMKAVIDKMSGYGKYLEIYLADLIEPSMAPAWAYADTKLASASPGKTAKAQATPKKKKDR